MKPSFTRVALVGKLRSPEISATLQALRALLDKRGCEVAIERETAAELGLRGLDYPGLGRVAQLAIVVGGDGTMLAAARSLAGARVPLVGVNQGRVGFMTDIGHVDLQAGIGAPADEQLDRVHQDRLAGARLPRQHREAGGEFQRRLFDDDEVADLQRAQHGQSRSRLSSASLQRSFSRRVAK